MDNPFQQSGGRDQIARDAAAAAQSTAAAAQATANGKVTASATQSNGDSNYTITAPASGVETLFVRLTAALTAPRTWTLPAVSACSAQLRVIIVDEVGGIGATNTLTIQRAGSDTVNGGTNNVAATPYSQRIFKPNGSAAWSTDASLARKGAAETIAGAWTFSALPIFTGSLLFQAADELVTNSTTFVASSYLTTALAAGTYFFEMWCEIDTTATTSVGTKINFAFSGAATSAISVYRTAPTALTTVNQSLTYDNASTSLPYSVTSPSGAIAARITGRIVVTVAGTLNVQFAESTASSGNSATLKTGSYLRLQRLA